MSTSSVQNRALAVAMAVTALAGSLMAQAGTLWVSPARAQVAPKVFDFSTETVGGEPHTFTSIVGIWRVEAEGDNKVLAVDGRKWQEGQSAAGIADKARALYGERYAEFLDNVQAFAYFPYAVAGDVTDFREGEIAVRFKGYRAAWIRARESCSISSRTATTWPCAPIPSRTTSFSGSTSTASAPR